MAGGADEGEDVRRPLRRRVHGEEDVQDQGAVPAGELYTVFQKDLGRGGKRFLLSFQTNFCKGFQVLKQIFSL